MQAPAINSLLPPTILTLPTSNPRARFRHATYQALRLGFVSDALRRASPTTRQTLAGLSGALLVTCITTPFDVVKTRYDGFRRKRVEVLELKSVMTVLMKIC